MSGLTSYLAFRRCVPAGDLHAGPGHGADDPQHAARAAARPGIATAFGVAAGQAIWTLATSAGLAVVLAASGPLFLAIRLAGAAYLVYLGGRSLVGAFAPAPGRTSPGPELGSRREPSCRVCSATCRTRRWSPSSSACSRSSRDPIQASCCCSRSGSTSAC